MKTTGIQIILEKKHNRLNAMEFSDGTIINKNKMAALELTVLTVLKPSVEDRFVCKKNDFALQIFAQKPNNT